MPFCSVLSFSLPLPSSKSRALKDERNGKYLHIISSNPDFHINRPRDNAFSKFTQILRPQTLNASPLAHNPQQIISPLSVSVFSSVTLVIIAASLQRCRQIKYELACVTNKGCGVTAEAVIRSPTAFILVSLNVLWGSLSHSVRKSNYSKIALL